MNKTIKYGLVFSMFVLASMVAIAALPSMDNTIVADVVEEEIAETCDQYVAGTNVQWHGEVDLYLKRAGSDEWVCVVDNEPNLLTNIGGHRIRGLLNGTIATTSNIANLSLSNDAGAASAAWTELPAEIAANGLDRATAAAGLVNNGSTGAFNITHTWTASASQSCQLIGTHWVATDSTDNNLFSAIKFTQQNLLVNDQLQAIYSVTMS